MLACYTIFVSQADRDTSVMDDSYPSVFLGLEWSYCRIEIESKYISAFKPLSILSQINMQSTWYNSGQVDTKY